jgi:hypothetical protein
MREGRELSVWFAESKQKASSVLTIRKLQFQILMGSLALRRTKTTPGQAGQALVQLPSKTVMLMKVGGGAGLVG